MRIVGCLASAALMAGCVSMSNIQPGADLNLGPDEGVVIIGAPADAEMIFHSGNVSEGKFSADGWLPDGITGRVESGYLVRKLKATEDGRGYGMVSVKASRYYYPKCGDTVAVFSVKTGEVQYFGDFAFTHKGTSVGVHHSYDAPAAHAHFRRIFPSNTSPISQGTIEVAKKGGC